MYTQENYFWGLLAYGLGVLLMMPAMVKVTGFIIPWKPPRLLFRILLVTILVTPVYAYGDVEFLAPAWIVAAFEFVRSSSSNGLATALAVLSAACVVATLLVVVYYVGCFLHRRGKHTAEYKPDTDSSEAEA